MHQPVMIGPTADAVQPGFEHLELAVPKFRIEFLQQEYSSDFLFEVRPRKELIRYLDQKVEPEFLSQFPPIAARRPAKIGRIPSVRLDLVFEKPLHAGGMFS
jgi:hypothetical protein